MNESDIFDEKREAKRATYSCPTCREQHEYEVLWLKRTKKKNLPRNLNERDKAQMNNSRDYMVRIDDVLMCKNNRCRKRFDIPNSQTIVFI